MTSLHFELSSSGAKILPASLCVSVNDEVVHGIPDSERILKEGDIVALDLGLKHQGLYRYGFDRICRNGG